MKVKLNVRRRRWEWSQVYDDVFRVTFEGDTDACDKGQYIYCPSEKIRQTDSYLVVLLTVDLYNVDVGAQLSLVWLQVCMMVAWKETEVCNAPKDELFIAIELHRLLNMPTLRITLEVKARNSQPGLCSCTMNSGAIVLYANVTTHGLH